MLLNRMCFKWNHKIYCATEQFLYFIRLQHHFRFFLLSPFIFRIFWFKYTPFHEYSRMFFPRFCYTLFSNSFGYGVWFKKKQSISCIRTHTPSITAQRFTGFTEFHSLNNFNCVAHVVCVCVCQCGAYMWVYCACNAYYAYDVTLLPLHSFRSKKKLINYTSFAGFFVNTWVYRVQRGQTFGSLVCFFFTKSISIHDLCLLWCVISQMSNVLFSMNLSTSLELPKTILYVYGAPLCGFSVQCVTAIKYEECDFHFFFVSGNEKLYQKSKHRNHMGFAGHEIESKSY